MFKYLKYRNYHHKTDSYIYRLIDSEFECDAFVESQIIFDMDLMGVDFIGAEVIEASVLIISEYEKRNYSCDKIIKNLLKYNLHICVQHKYNLYKLLKLQRKYIDKYLKSMSFNKKYYKMLKCELNKYKAFI